MPPIRALRERETRTRFDRSGVEIYPTRPTFIFLPSSSHDRVPRADNESKSRWERRVDRVATEKNVMAELEGGGGRRWLRRGRGRGGRERQWGDAG
jgi:hypothetical protein